jgi:RimJ/RimL family protein N-acetyltransferase
VPPASTGCLRGEGFSLRPPRLSDAAAYHALGQDADVKRWSRPGVLSFEQAAAEIAAAVAVAAPEVPSLVMIVDGEDTVVGALSVAWYGTQRASIGYDLLPGARGRGIATASLRLLSRWLLERHPELVRIELWSIVGNDASDRVAERAGFLREGVLRSRLPFGGTLRDVTVFSRLRTDAS